MLTTFTEFEIHISLTVTAEESTKRIHLVFLVK